MMVRKVTAATPWQGKAPEPLHDTLAPNGNVVDALSRQGFTYTRLITKFLQPMGNTTVHLVPYHEGQQDIAHGLPRAECGAHEMGWYAAVNIRTLDEAPPAELIEQLEKATAVGVAGHGGEQGKVLVTLGHTSAAGLCIYTVSLIDTDLWKLAAGRAKVNRVAFELLVEKEIAAAPGMALADGITELADTLTR